MALGLAGSTCSRQTQCRASCLRPVVPAPLQRPFASAVGLRTCSGAFAPLTQHTSPPPQSRETLTAYCRSPPLRLSPSAGAVSQARLQHDISERQVRPFEQSLQKHHQGTELILHSCSNWSGGSRAPVTSLRCTLCAAVCFPRVRSSIRYECMRRQGWEWRQCPPGPWDVERASVFRTASWVGGRIWQQPSTRCSGSVWVQVHTNAFAGADFTDKPVPNAFWRAFAALIYIIPCIDTFTLGTTVYNIFPQMIVIAIAGCAPPAPQLVE